MNKTAGKGLSQMKGSERFTGGMKKENSNIVKGKIVSQMVKVKKTGKK